jgi:hypothetical protein
MKRIVFSVLIFLFIAGLCTATVLILNRSPNVSNVKITPSTQTIEIKWGEGSEAGVPDATTKK